MAVAWATKAPLPAERSFAATVAADKTGPQSHIYVIGGYDAGGVSQTTVYEYDVAMNTWTTLANIPQDLFLTTHNLIGLAEMAVAAIGQYVYIMAGASRFQDVSTLAITTGTSYYTARYDTINGTWLRLVDFVARRRPLAAVFRQYSGGSDTWEDKIHFGGGLDANGNVWTGGYVYNPRLNSFGTNYAGRTSPGTDVSNAAIGSDGGNLWWAGRQIDINGFWGTAGAELTATTLANPDRDIANPLPAEEIVSNLEHLGHTLPHVQGRIFMCGGEVAGVPSDGVYSLHRGTYTWSTENPLPAAVSKHGTCQAQGKLYVIGGLGSSAVYEGTYTKPPVPPGEWDGLWSWMPRAEGTMTAYSSGGIDYLVAIGGRMPGPGWGRRLSRYNISTGEWEHRSMDPLTNGRVLHNAVLYGGAIYVLGGQSNSYYGITDSRKYDPDANTWTYIGAMPNAHSEAYAAEVGGLIYIIGGIGPSQGVFTAKIDVYDPVANTWSSKADAPWDIARGWAFSLGEYIYLIGGQWRAIGTTGTPSNLTSIWRYHPTTEAWEEVGDLGGGTSANFVAFALAYERYVALVGGNQNPFSISTIDKHVVRFYDTLSKWWGRKMDFPFQLEDSHAAFIGGKLYVHGGFTWGSQSNGTRESGWDGSLFEMTIETSNVTIAVDRENAAKGAYPVRGVLTVPTLTDLASGWDVVGKPTAHEALADHHISTRVYRGQAD